MKSDLRKIRIGDKIWTIEAGWEEVTDIEAGHPYQIETEKGNYTINGKVNIHDKYPSAFLEYPFKAEPIEKIEKDTLVWFRDKPNDFWKYGYYSHFENGKHYIFNDSKKSTETSTIQAWYIVTTENPLT
jgi:DNA helicase HerA-like ATPase